MDEDNPESRVKDSTLEEAHEKRRSERKNAIDADFDITGR